MQEIKKINLSIELRKFSELTINFDKERIPLSSSERESKKGKYPYYGAQGIIDHVDEYIFDGEYLLIAEDGENLNSRSQPIANVVLGKFWVNNHAHIVKTNSKCEIHYLCYLLNNINISGYITGSAQPKLNQYNLNNMVLEIQDYETQYKISIILKRINDKIKLNEKINKNLEQLIKYIYINWFEEFEPFKDKDFYDTKLGSIPVGWDVKPLQEFIKFQEGPGIRNWQYVEEDGINFLNIRCIQNNDLVLDTANMISKEEANGKYAHFMLNEWDLVISSSGTLGRYAIVREEHLPLCLNTSIIRFTPMHSFDHYAYVYSYLTSRGFYHYLLTMGSGSVQLNFGPTHLKQIDLIVPPENILKKYNDLIFPLIEQMVTIKSEISKLTKLRDTLLPKLMSGEIDVSKINCDLELKYNYMKYLFNQIHTPMSKSVV